MASNLTTTLTAVEPTVPQPSRDPMQIEAQDDTLVFPYFTSQTAWALGSALRTRLLGFAKPAVIDISLANSNHCLFHATTHSGTKPEHDSWVARKRNSVLRFGWSTWYLHNLFSGDEEAFAAKFALGSRANEFAIHGGGWPVRVQGVEGVVAVVVVSGLKQEQDHGVILQTVEEILLGMGVEIGEKKKED